jgi:hypothetical protein
MSVKSLLTIAAASTIALMANLAHADPLTSYTSASAFAFGATGGSAPLNQVADQVNWAAFDTSLGQPTQNGSIPYGSSMTTVAGEAITVTQSVAPHKALTTYVEGAGFVNSGLSGWDGNFVGGTTVLYNFANSTTTLSFGSALSGLGVDLQTKNAGAYTFTITAYDSSNNVLGTATNTGVSPGTSASNGTAFENQAVFAGLTSTSANISYVTISSTNNSSGFAIDTSLIYHTNINGLSNGVGGTTTPEPGTLALLGAGLAALGAVRRRRNRAA